MVVGIRNGTARCKKCKQLLESGGKSYRLYLNVVHFFITSVKIDICGSLKQLCSCIGI
jgi:hypothetical protein